MKFHMVKVEIYIMTLQKSNKPFIPWNKGLTKDTDRRLLNSSIRMTTNNPAKLLHVRKKISIANTGHVKTKEQIEKQRSSLKGKIPKNISQLLAIDRKDEKNKMWKGDDVGYGALHRWVRGKLGEPKKCSVDESHTAKMFVWANKSGLYKRDVSDWHELCQSCNTKDSVKVPQRLKKNVL